MNKETSLIQFKVSKWQQWHSFRADRKEFSSIIKCVLVLLDQEPSASLYCSFFFPCPVLIFWLPLLFLIWNPLFFHLFEPFGLFGCPMRSSYSCFILFAVLIALPMYPLLFYSCSCCYQLSVSLFITFYFFQLLISHWPCALWQSLIEQHRLKCLGDTEFIFVCTVYACTCMENRVTVSPKDTPIRFFFPVLIH